jgi:hypothetical protein
VRSSDWLVVFLGALAAGAALACGGSADPATPTPTAASRATATSAPTSAATAPPTEASASLEEEIADAYLAYWEAYKAALLNLDASLVEDVAAGEELERIRGQIEGLKADGVAARVVVEHDFAVVQTDEESAVVIDEFLDRSFYVDAVTKQPETSDVEGRRARDVFHFRRGDEGRWVVTLSVREP